MKVDKLLELSASTVAFISLPLQLMKPQGWLKVLVIYLLSS